MKIYCTEQDFLDFYPYVGKNVWIKVKCLFGNQLSIYIRILESLGETVTGDHYIRANWIKCSDVDRLRSNPDKYMSLPGAYRVQESTHNFALEDLEIIQPIDIIPGEELFPTARNILLTEIIGQPIWVKCSMSSSRYSSYYVKFNTILEDVVNCDFIDNYNVEEYEYEGQEGNLPSETIHSGNFFTDVFVPYEPYEFLTDSELTEMLNANDAVFWEGYRRDDIGNYFNDEEWEQENEE